MWQIKWQVFIIIVFACGPSSRSCSISKFPSNVQLPISNSCVLFEPNMNEMHCELLQFVWGEEDVESRRDPQPDNNAPKCVKSVFTSASKMQALKSCTVVQWQEKDMNIKAWVRVHCISHRHCATKLIIGSVTIALCRPPRLRYPHILIRTKISRPPKY